MQFSDSWAAITTPMKVLEQIPTGMVTTQQMQLIRQTYPALANWMKGEVLQRLAKMDADGVQVPVHAVDTLDVLLDLGDAAGPTHSTSFSLKYSQQMGDRATQARQPKPPAPSSKGSIGARMKSGTDAMLSGT